MKKQIFILIGIIALSMYSIIIHAQDDGNRPDFNTWTESQIRNWEDSVKNVLYPKLEIKTTTIDESRRKKDDDSTKSRASNNTYVPNSVTVDFNKAVGEIPMTSAVSPVGAITYNVPVEVYPGQRNMQPQISISYNNRAENSILGVGWGIGGLSSINRGSRSMYYDVKSQGVSLTKEDAFYVDGMRLIKTSETSTQIKYESEQGNIKATANLNGTVVKYFDVYYPNGTKGTYGYTNNSSTNYLEYPLTSLSDLFTNTITYSYTYTDNHYRINNINYANASVEFQYTTTTRTDVITSYSGGLKVREDKLLQKIVCKYGSAVLRNYEFTYTFQKEASLLIQIDYTASNGSKFNPLKFYYGENNTATVYDKNETQLLQWYVWTDPKHVTVNKGKFDYGTDNDGLIVLPAYNPYWQHYRGSNLFQHSQNRFDNYYSGTESIFLYAGLNDSYASPMPNLTTENGFIDIFCANLDGKWEEEVVKVNNVVSGSNDQVTFKTYTPNLYYGLAIKYPTRTFNFPTVLTDADGGKSIHPKFYFTGDFNGDGKMEILVVSCHQPFGWTANPTNCYLLDLESNIKLYEGQPFAYNVSFLGTQQTDSATAVQNTDRLFVFDYDGDGKSDICLINASGTYIYTFSITGSTYSFQQVASYTGLKRSDLDGRILMLGEFNGDGKPDFLLSPKINNSDWYIYYAMGNGQFEKVQVSIYSRLSSYRYVLQDVNSDGLTDVIEYTTGSFYTYRAKSGGFSSYESFKSFDYTNPVIVPTNINSRYSFNQLIALKDGKVTRFSYPRNDTKEKLLTGSVTSLGVVNKNYYRMLNDSYGYSFYTEGYNAVYPYENFKGSVFVPECREQYFNGQKNENLSYYYENAVIHKQGLGFRGFEKITTYDQVRGRTRYQKFDPFNFSVLKEEDSPVTKNIYTYAYTVANDKIAKVRLTNLSTQDKLKNVTVTIAYTHDTYGSPLTETINYGGGITETISNSYYNNTNESSYLLGFPYDKTNTINRNGVTWSERSFISSHSNGNPSILIRYANGNQILQETFGYDSKGNKTSHGVKTYSSSNILTTNYIYDSYGRLTQETDPLGFTTTYEFNTTNGSLSKVKNHKNQETVFSYDPFWRVGQTNYPDGAIKTLSYSWNPSSKGTNSLYCIYQHHYGRPWTKNYFDALGRETASSVLIPDGDEPGPDKLYDNYGRLWKVSLPVTNGLAGSLWNEYQYDSYDRITKLTEPSGRITNYSYSGNSVTSTIDGISSTQNFDTQGNLISVVDPGGTITYNLRPDGQPSSIVAPGSITTSFGYDIYGRETSITDPSAGFQSRTYDSAGRFYTETDANSATTAYEYDSYNRLKRKTSPEFVVNYRYNSDGLLAADSINSTLFTAYTYDVYGRLLTEKETVSSGKWLQKNYGYWGNGELGYITYSLPDGFITQEFYSNVYENLKTITVDGTAIWNLNTVNVFGQPTSATTGSFNRSYGYNQYGIPTGRTAGSFQNHTYSFDATKGNLTSRKDNIKNIQENFTYDNMNRLTGYAGISTGYDLNGNINSRSDIGTFQYNTPSKPYAISKVASLSSAIPSRNQLATYTSFKRPATISEGEYTAAFTYNGNGGRVKMELKRNGVKEMDRYYISDSYEIDDRSVGGIKEKLYLGGNFYTAPAVYVKESGGSWNLYYICRDYLGSITHITNSSGSVVQELSYDAWGRLRNPVNQTAYTPDSEPVLFLGRGYTGHEHLTQFGLINMNARLYDPAIGRFLSPDPFVQDPLFSQNFNRYSYCFNNPLKYTDPDGEYALIDDLIAAVAGGIVNVVVNAFQGNIHSWGQGFSYFGVGAAGTWAGLYAGPLASGAIIGSGNNFVTQGFGSNGNWNWSNISYDQVLMRGLMGAGMSYLGGQVSDLISPYVSNLTSGIGGQAVQQGLSQAITNSATGFTINAGSAWFQGASFKEGLKEGGKGALMSFGIGFSSGLVTGMRSAYKAGENPWTGKALSTKSDWNYGDHKSQAKWENQMKQRGWTEQQINEAIKFKDSYSAPNNISPSNGATRYIHPTTGRSIVIDNVTKGLLHVGGDGFKY